MSLITISFSVCLLAFLVIGLISAAKSRKTANDYLMAGKSVPPWLAGLSAAATNNSGFMFIGIIGLSYKAGLSAIWIMLGSVFGDMLASGLTARKIRRISSDDKIYSFGDLLSRWQGGDYRKLRMLVGFLTVFFLTLYSAAQLKAGAKAASVLLNWDMAIGVVISALMVLAYSLAGGIRASIWTDAAQSFVMIFGMSALLITALKVNGGIAETAEKLSMVQEGYMNVFPDKPNLLLVFFIVGWLFGGGVGVIGQPHIVVRFMSLDKAENVNRMRAFYYAWYMSFYAMTIIVGWLSRITLSKTARFDPELALPVMAQNLMPAIFVGLILAAVFAATMSTADSLILTCSASVVRDFSARPTSSLKTTKIITFAALCVAVGIALIGERSVLNLVLDAWGLLGSAFAPLIIVYALGRAVFEKQAIVMIILGIAAFVSWEHLGFGNDVYSAFPGILTGLLSFFLMSGLASLNTKSRSS